MRWNYIVYEWFSHRALDRFVKKVSQVVASSHGATTMATNCSFEEKTAVAKSHQASD